SDPADPRRIKPVRPVTDVGAVTSIPTRRHPAEPGTARIAGKLDPGDRIFAKPTAFAGEIRPAGIGISVRMTIQPLPVLTGRWTDSVYVAPGASRISSP